MAKIRTDADFIASLNGSQRHYFPARAGLRTPPSTHSARAGTGTERGQRSARTISRGTARKCMTRARYRPTGPSHARAGGEHRRS